METISLRVSDGAELPLQASKWLDFQFLVDGIEMEALFKELGDFHIFQVGKVCSTNEGYVMKEQFLQVYRAYIDCLKHSKLPDENDYRLPFSVIFTAATDHVFQIPVPNQRHIIRVQKPVLQLQVNQIAYSPADGKFRGLVFGKDSILWGLQISYPQLFQDANKNVFNVLSDPQFPNTPLLRKLQQWLRQFTVPTPFQVGEERINVPIRLGKQCFSWINTHPQLIESPIRVIVK